MDIDDRNDYFWTRFRENEVELQLCAYCLNERHPSEFGTFSGKKMCQNCIEDELEELEREKLSGQTTAQIFSMNGFFPIILSKAI